MCMLTKGQGHSQTSRRNPWSRGCQTACSGQHLACKNLRGVLLLRQIKTALWGAMPCERCRRKGIQCLYPISAGGASEPDDIRREQPLEEPCQTPEGTEIAGPFNQMSTLENDHIIPADIAPPRPEYNNSSRNPTSPVDLSGDHALQNTTTSDSASGSAQGFSSSFVDHALQSFDADNFADYFFNFSPLWAFEGPDTEVSSLMAHNQTRPAANEGLGDAWAGHGRLNCKIVDPGSALNSPTQERLGEPELGTDSYMSDCPKLDSADCDTIRAENFCHVPMLPDDTFPISYGFTSNMNAISCLNLSKELPPR